MYFFALNLIHYVRWMKIGGLFVNKVMRKPKGKILSIMFQ